jgi:hypothetical protein
VISSVHSNVDLLIQQPVGTAVTRRNTARPNKKTELQTLCILKCGHFNMGIEHLKDLLPMTMEVIMFQCYISVLSIKCNKIYLMYFNYNNHAYIVFM